MLRTTLLLVALLFARQVGAYESVPGRFHFAEDKDSKSCILIAEGFKTGLTIVAKRDRVLMAVTLLSGRRPADRDDGFGTITLANQSRSKEQLTVPFKREQKSSNPDHVAAYIAFVTRNELQKVLMLIKTASGDPDGALMFRYGNLEERFPTAAGKDAAAAMQACAATL